MKLLLKKEMTLTAAPLTYFFIAFSVMTMIPGYPILVGAFFICLGIFYTFQFGREYNDVLYTALLPVKKSDVVKTKYAFSIGIQLVSFCLMAIMTIIRMTSFSNAPVYVNNAMMNANLIYLGYAFVVFALFNIIFLRGFFKTAYYIGKPFILYIIASFLVIAAAEALHHFPGLEFLNETDTSHMQAQCMILVFGIVFYVVGTFLSMKAAEKYFEQIDL